jgi:hypothetical protein
MIFPWIVWLLALSLGILLTILLGERASPQETLAAWGLVFGIWQISLWRFIASRAAISKMSTAWTSHILLLSVRRVLLTLAASVLLYFATGAGWGLTYWLSIVIYYQVGVALSVREVYRLIPT